MFVRYFVDLPLPRDDAEDALLREPGAWIPALAREAERYGESLVREPDSGPFSRRVEIEIGAPVRFPTHTALPMTWRSTEGQALFSTLEADIELADILPSRTQLSISARYAPPLGGPGTAIDRATLQRVAETTVKEFLDRASEKIQALAGGATPVPR